MNFDFGPIIYFFLALGVCLGLATGGLIYGCTRIANQYDIKVEKKN